MRLPLEPVFASEGLGGASRRGPWVAGQVVAIAGANALAVALTLAAWWATSGTGRATTQVGWSSVGLLGLIVALAANAWFLARGRQTVRVAHRTVLTLGCFGSFSGDSGAPVVSGNDPVLRPTASGSHYVSVPGTIRYHRPSCPLAAQKDVDQDLRSVHESAGRRACEVCEP